MILHTTLSNLCIPSKMDGVLHLECWPESADLHLGQIHLLNESSKLETYSMLNTFKKIILSCVVLAALSVSAVAQNIEPGGIYFNRFTGPFNGTEYFEVTQVNGNTFNTRDIYGGGWTGTISPDGVVTIAGFPNDGMFSSPDDFVIFPVFAGGTFTFDSSRVPTTGTNFPLRLQSPRPAESMLAGQWVNTLRSINPETGQSSAPATEVINISVSGNTVRITDPGGLFFQGVFENGRNAAFRVVNNPFFGTASPGYRTFPGSSTNIGQDLLGEMNMISINEFRASFLLQSRQQLGNQTQSLFEFSAVRSQPFEIGDVNGDGAVDGQDLQIVGSLQGVDLEDNSYQLAADINNDGVIDQLDFDFFDFAFETTVDSINIFRGFPISGSIINTEESDDLYFTLQPGFTLNSSEPPVWLISDGTLPSDSPDSLLFSVEANANTPNIQLAIESFNWNTGEYDLIGQENTSFNSDSIIDVDLVVADHVESGTGAVRTRTGWRRNGFIILFPWLISLDRIHWESN